MSARTKFVLFHGAFGTPERQIEGVFHEMQNALAYAREMAGGLALRLSKFEVEGWRGRDFVGAWDHEGKLIENRKGEDLRTPHEFVDGKCALCGAGAGAPSLQFCGYPK